ncbi:MAG: endonuclease domain-containing protein, partial [Alphaproteobacteria bacterium]|nr:endonuclease domain-containing protein [Alphaproteobacteria bacterium]
MANGRARTLRANMTEAETRLWSLLRARRLGGRKFRRQHPIGPYILDFACVDCRLAIEADGGQHANAKADERRTDFLQARCWSVLRFWN